MEFCFGNFFKRNYRSNKKIYHEWYWEFYMLAWGRSHLQKRFPLEVCNFSENHKPDETSCFSWTSRFIRIFGTFYTINNILWKTMSCHSTRLLFLPLINFTSCDFCFFFLILFHTFSTLIYLAPFFLLFLLFKFFSLHCLFFCLL